MAVWMSLLSAEAMLCFVRNMMFRCNEDRQQCLERPGLQPMPSRVDRAVAALDVIRAGGRQIGVLSNVQGLAEKIGVQVKVVARGDGRAEVRVVGA